MDDPGKDRFKKLPEQIRPEDTVETSDVDPHPPFNDGPLQEAAWLIRTASP